MDEDTKLHRNGYFRILTTERSRSARDIFKKRKKFPSPKSCKANIDEF